MPPAPGPSGARNLFISLDDTLKSPTPKPAYGPYLARPLPSTGSSVSVNVTPNPSADPAPPPTPHTPIPGLRQLGQLLPRHTHFRARVTIHQISSVPLVSGEFGVRWKFKGVQTHGSAGAGANASAGGRSKAGLLDRVKARAEKRALEKGKGKAREDSADAVEMSLQVGTGPLPLSVSASASGSRPPLAANRTGTASSASSHSSSVAHVSQHLSADWGAGAGSSATTPSTSASATTLLASSASSPLTTPSDLPSSPLFANPFSSSSSSSASASASTPARGSTPFLPLKDHAVSWAHTLDLQLKLDVARDAPGSVQPSPLKLVVMQKVIPGDPRGAPGNPRLGAVYLNLAEYIGQGAVERRYLLKESRTNATLKLTIEMAYLSGEAHYTPPPLAKGEILNGIAGFLESDVVKRRPRALDLDGPDDEEEGDEGVRRRDDAEGEGGRTAVPRTARTARKASDKSSPWDSESEEDDDDDDHNEDGLDDDDDEYYHSSYGDEGDDNDNNDGNNDGAENGDTANTAHAVAFDVRRLPAAYSSTKTTEHLIDALFNPVRTTDRRAASPFTVWVPPSPGRDVGAGGRSTGGRSRSRQRAEQARGLRLGVGVGLGLSGVPLPLGADAQGQGQGKRQGSISSSVYTTTTTATTSTTASSVCSSALGGGAAGGVGGGGVGAGGTPTPVPHAQPDSRTLVGGQGHAQGEEPDREREIGRESERTGTGTGSMRAWWRKKRRGETPTGRVRV